MKGISGLAPILSLVSLESNPVAVAVGVGMLKVVWKDGHESLYPYKFLRENCPCAVCKGEPGLFGEGSTPPKPEAPEGIKPLGVDEVGRYAIAPVWSDGHRTGIYSFEYLRTLCPCPQCRPQP